MKQAKNDNNSTYSKTHKKLIYVELHINQSFHKMSAPFIALYTVLQFPPGLFRE